MHKIARILGIPPHRRSLPLVPRIFPELVRDAFTVIEEAQWEWLADLPEKERPGRGYEVAGYILKLSDGV